MLERILEQVVDVPVPRNLEEIVQGMDVPVTQGTLCSAWPRKMDNVPITQEKINQEIEYINKVVDVTVEVQKQFPQKETQQVNLGWTSDTVNVQ